jgi:hypothetical protein
MLDDQPRVSLIGFKDAPDFSGPLLRDDGRLAVCNRGRGFCIQLGPDQLREFARRMIGVAALLEQRQAEIATEAADGLQHALSRAGSPSDDDDA